MPKTRGGEREGAAPVLQRAKSGPGKKGQKAAHWDQPTLPTSQKEGLSGWPFEKAAANNTIWKRERKANHDTRSEG